MDPNANLQEQERILTRNAATVGPVHEDNRRLRELRDALRNWINGGGFEPDWSKAPNAAKYFGKGATR